MFTENRGGYSTTETLTGETWIDGKPIYRKTFLMGNQSSNNTSLDYVTDIPTNSIDKVISINGTGTLTSTSRAIPYMYFNTDGTYTNSIISGFYNYNSNGYLGIRFSGHGFTATWTNIYVIIEYTKTT